MPGGEGKEDQSWAVWGQPLLDIKRYSSPAIIELDHNYRQMVVPKTRGLGASTHPWYLRMTVLLEVNGILLDTARRLFGAFDEDS